MRKKTYNYYRHPKTAQEKRANQDCKYARAKRRPRNLADWWDERHISSEICCRKSWKAKRKTQYREGKRGKKHTMWFDDKTSLGKLWKLEQYFKDYGIPFNCESHRESYIKKYITTHTRVKYCQIPVFTPRWNWPNKKRHQIGYQWEYKKVKLEKPIVYYRTWSKITGYTINWWSDKDIGIDYILKRIQL